MLSRPQDQSAIGRILCQWKIPMTPSGIELATFRFVAQHLNHCATAVPLLKRSIWNFTLLCTCLSDLDKFRYNSCPIIFINLNAPWISKHLGHTSRIGVNEFLTVRFTFIISLGEIKYRDLHKNLQRIYEFYENRARDGRTFVMVVNKITFPRVPWKCKIG